jgi:aerobic carbon-monoxide dehydrogenase small subunit
MEPRKIRFKLNGASVAVSVMPYETLIEMLSGRFELKGARESCGQGLCGCCTVYVNGKSVSSCLYLAGLVDGAEVTTIEGISNGLSLDPVQEAFIEAGAFQCGFCTPGFIMMVRELLDKYPEPTDEEIRHYLTGNLCRCSAYPEIVEAVNLAALRRRQVANALPARGVA